jgi:predicted NBD/HSP70 family sugar kinase
MTRDINLLWGVDLGGTKIEIVVCEVSPDQIHALYRRRIPTERDRGYDAIVENIVALVNDTCKDFGNAPSRLGIGTPGVLDPRARVLKNSNTLCLNGMPLESDLSDILNIPVIIANDANCFALAEAQYGAGRGAEVVFGVIMGTGVGGGVVIEGKARYGFQGIAGEWGHTVLDRAGPECYCGKRGCVESFLSGPALEERYYLLSGSRRSLHDIAMRAELGEDSARELKAFARDAFVKAIASVINILDPDRVVLGGGVSNADWFYDEKIFDESHEVFNSEVSNPVVRHQLGDSAGVFGAALLGAV